MAEEGFQSGKYEAFMVKLEELRRVYAQNTVEVKKLIRIMQSAGFHDPQDFSRAARSGLQAPRAQPPQPQRPDVLASVAQHFMKAFPPEDIRDMAEELLDGLTRKRRRR